MRRRTAQRPSSSRAERIGDGERRVTARRLQSPTETIVDRETSGGSVRERVEVQRTESARHFHGPADEYLTLAQLEAYSKISGRQLRNYLALPPGQALPCYRPGRKVLVRRSEFDIWVTRFRQRGKPVLTRVLRELGLDPERLPDTRLPRAVRGTVESSPAQ
jgi:hypothetical protein